MLARLVAVEPGAFDDSHVPGHTFGGLGFIRTSPKRPAAGASGYYLRLHRRAARFDQGTAPEVRHTLGARTWGGWAEVDYNYEAVLQWGSFGRGPIRAWAIATDTGYLLTSSRWPTRIGVRADLTTGDRRPDDPALQTFNPLFPGTAYSGRAGLVGPANSIDVTPSVRVAPGRRLTVTLDHAWFWRHSVHDGMYGIAVNVVRPGSESRARGVGRQFTAQADIRGDDHLTFTIAFTAFTAGRFLRETPPGADVAFVTVSSITASNQLSGVSSGDGRVNVMIQFVSHVFPASSENACSIGRAKPVSPPRRPYSPFWRGAGFCFPGVCLPNCPLSLTQRNPNPTFPPAREATVLGLMSLTESVPTPMMIASPRRAALWR